ncbi:hypothetical protein ANN_26178 [Periplaneta americana]|uniref:DUF4817 domain-containing protein n=1 Tax=Periplaneta americana TaxID=6978 RepID=A0ABQ8S5J9_PERAM|nr:hypothetical protein ANN_26178 [Periplaneta americana]
MKAQTVLWYAEFKSIVRVQREYRRVFNHDAPTAKSIKKWHDTFLAPGSVLKKHGGGHRTSDEMVADVQAAYERSLWKSLRRALREVPKSTLQRIVHKCLKLYTYKVQLMQRLEPDDKPKRVEFANMILDNLGADPDFMSKIFFSDKATFHVTGKVNRKSIIEAIESIPEDMLQHAWQEIVHRLDIVTVTAGAHIEIWNPSCIKVSTKTSLSPHNTLRFGEKQTTFTLCSTVNRLLSTISQIDVCARSYGYILIVMLPIGFSMNFGIY